MVTEKGIRYERKVPVSSDTLQVLQLIGFKAQVALGVLVEGFGWPTVEISAQNAFWLPIFTIGGIEIRCFGKLDLVFISGHNTHFLAFQVFHGQHLGKGPEQMVPNPVRTIGFRRDGADVVLQLTPASLDQHIAVLGTAADPVQPELLQCRDQGPAQEPAVEQDDTEGQLPLDGLLNQFSCQSRFGTISLLAIVITQQTGQVLPISAEVVLGLQFGRLLL